MKALKKIFRPCFALAMITIFSPDADSSIPSKALLYQMNHTQQKRILKMPYSRNRFLPEQTSMPVFTLLNLQKVWNIREMVLERRRNKIRHAGNNHRQIRRCYLPAGS